MKQLSIINDPQKILCTSSEKNITCLQSFWLYLIQRSRMIISGCFEVLKDKIKEYRMKSSLNAKSKLLKLSKISNIKFLPSDCRSSFQASGFAISYFICLMFRRGETNSMNQHPTLFTFIFCVLDFSLRQKK